MKKKILFIGNCFCIITACVLVVTALFTTVINPVDSITPYTLWQILITSFLCSLSTLIYPWERAIQKTEFHIRVCIHYIVINIIVLGFGWRFEWYHPDNIRSVTAMLVSIAAVFIFVSYVSRKRAARDAKRMNEQLEKYKELP
ncbi:MAG: DUF3021 domain-containing protein [Bacillus sp. (in: Bacteria)]|nr:DUF3021 domain-containing protein [Bacillus sp. (in: firmicutes)]MCM1428040.1 DUF3021 domain-containing protein [Eubacterium sp.]